MEMQVHDGISFWHRIKILTYKFLALVLLISSGSRGTGDICRLCCHIQGLKHNLNCSWESQSHTEHTLYVLRLKKQSCGLGSSQTDCPDSHLSIPSLLNFTAPVGQNWLLIPRKNLVKFYPYHLRLTAGGKEVQLNLTYDVNGENVLLEPPEITAVESEEDNIVEVKWRNQEHVSDEQKVELRYRMVGAANWTEVPNNKLEPGSCELTDLEPYVEYKLQIRYVADGSSSKKGSRWSETLTFCTPDQVPCGLLDVWRSTEKPPFLLIQWKPLGTTRGKILGYNVTYTDGGQANSAEAQCCHIKLPAGATDICVSPRNQHGLGYGSCVTPPCSEPAPPSGIKVWADGSGGIKVSGVATLPPPKDPHSYLVEWKELTLARNPFLNWTRFRATNQNFTLPGDFAPFAPYGVAVFALYQNSCAGVVSTVVYSQENAPSAGPNVSIRLISSAEAHISWDEVPLPNRRGNITGYTIYLNSSEHSRQKSALWSRSVFAHGRNDCVSGLSPDTAYTVWMTAWTRAGEGPLGSIRKFRTTGRTYNPLVIIIIVVLTVFFLLLAILFSLWTKRVLRKWFWPRIPIPNLENNAELSRIQNNNNWDLEQENPNTPIAIVEEIEPPTCPPRPQQGTFTSGYEKHFLPTQEEVMGLW